MDDIESVPAATGEVLGEKIAEPSVVVAQSSNNTKKYIVASVIGLASLLLTFLARAKWLKKKGEIFLKKD
jgi:hypothetical protein